MVVSQLSSFFNFLVGILLYCGMHLQLKIKLADQKSDKIVTLRVKLVLTESKKNRQKRK